MPLLTLLYVITKNEVWWFFSPMKIWHKFPKLQNLNKVVKIRA